MNDRDRLPPGMGERRAIDRVAAGLILRALRDGALESVLVADPEAGRVDDLQIASVSTFGAGSPAWTLSQLAHPKCGLNRGE
jgi:hypothetical protein